MAWNYQQIHTALPEATLNLESSWTGGKIEFDSRLVAKGDIFIALPGAVRDGHDFVFDAVSKGASAAIVSKSLPEFSSQLPLIIVEDCLAALNNLAAFKRKEFKNLVVGITGSLGKTSCKEAVALAMNYDGNCYYAKKSFNNHIGVPLTIANLPENASSMVLEIGMNHAGEIEPLSKLAKPDVMIITHIAPVHIGTLGSLEAIAEAKAEIFAGAAGKKIALLNLEDSYFPYLAARAELEKCKVLSFSSNYNSQAEYKLSFIDKTSMELKIQNQNLIIALPDIPSQLYMYLLVALAVAEIAEIDIFAAAKRLENYTSYGGRGSTLKLCIDEKHITIIDESYNSSPLAAQAALTNLVSNPTSARRIAILGDMHELGEFSYNYHTGLAPYCVGVDYIATCGNEIKVLAELLPESQHLFHFDHAEDFDIAHFISKLNDGDLILIKGSRGLRLEQLIQRLKELVQC